MAIRERRSAFSDLSLSFSSWACSMACFCLSRDCFAAVRLASLRSFRRCSFSSSDVARGRTYRFTGREMTVVAGETDGDREVVIMGGGGIGAEFGEVDIYGDVEDAGMRRECGLTVDGNSDATFIIFPSMIKPSLCMVYPSLSWS